MIAVAVCCAPCSGLLFASRAVGSNMGRRVGALENCLVMAAKSLVRAWQRGARAEAGGCDLADRIRFAIAAWFDTTRLATSAGRRSPGFRGADPDARTARLLYPREIGSAAPPPVG